MYLPSSVFEHRTSFLSSVIFLVRCNHVIIQAEVPKYTLRILLYRLFGTPTDKNQIGGEGASMKDNQNLDTLFHKCSPQSRK